MPQPATDLAARIDHTLLAATATRPQVMKIVSEALEHSFASVCVNPIFTAAVAEKLAAVEVKTCVVAGFPLGANKPTLKAIEATAAAKDGADEIDVVAHLPHLLAEDIDAARAELLEVVRAVREVRRDLVVKVIIESAALSHDVSDDQAQARIAVAAVAARESGCDFIKTSTGFHPAGGATEQAVRWMKAHAGPLKVKASGGIRTTDDAQRMLNAGADRLGCSASVAIVQGQTSTPTDY